MKIVKILVIASIFLNCSCLTKKMWRSQPYYFDTIKEFLISEDGTKIIFLGERYHYIFNDESGAIKDLLQWSGRSKLKMMVSKFDVGLKNNVQAEVILSINKNTVLTLSEKELNFIQKLNFSEQKLWNEEFMRKKIELNGTRYIPKPGVKYVTRSSLNKKYNVTVHYKNLSKEIEKIALTPLTVTLDAINFTIVSGAYLNFAAIQIPVYYTTCTFSSKIPCDQNPLSIK